MNMDLVNRVQEAFSSKIWENHDKMADFAQLKCR